MEEKHKICCVTGHRSKKFPWKGKVTKEKDSLYYFAYEGTLSLSIARLIEEGFDYFIFYCNACVACR